MEKMLNVTLSPYLILVMLPVSFYSQKPDSDSVDGTFTNPVTNANFQENKEEWPFLWGENEYVVDIGAAFILLSEAVNDLTHGK